VATQLLFLTTHAHTRTCIQNTREDTMFMPSHARVETNADDKRHEGSTGRRHLYYANNHSFYHKSSRTISYNQHVLTIYH